MSRKKGQTYTAEQKTKIVLEMLKEDMTTSQLSSKYGVTSQSLGKWKQQFLENASLAFDVDGATKVYKDEIEELKSKNEQLAKALGKATIKAEWVAGKLKSLDLIDRKSLIESKHKHSQVSNIQNIKSMSIYSNSTGHTMARKRVSMSQLQMKYGVEILLISASTVDLCISLPLLTRTQKLCLHIRFQTLWMQHLPRMYCKRHLKSIPNLKYSTLIREVKTSKCGCVAKFL